MSFAGRLNRSTVVAVAVGLAAMTASASHVDQTLQLSAGWNGVYLEVTPDDGDEATTGDALCETVFDAANHGAVMAVMAYESDAYESTRQINDDGSVIEQKPLSYLTWMREDSTGSSLRALRGGMCYLVYVDGSKLPTPKSTLSLTVTGVPRAPAMTWRDTTKGDFVNLVGLTLSTTDKVLASTCFKEGPYGNKGVLYDVKGTNSVPTFKSSFMGNAMIVSGRAYGASAERPGSWNGVIGFASADEVVFGADDSRAHLSVKNDSSTNRIFRFTVMGSSLAGENFPPELKRQLSRTDLMVEPAWTNLTQGSTWEVEIAPGKSVTEAFSINRLTMPQDTAYGAVLVIDDLSGTQMRVRVPIIIIKTSESAEAVQFPVGLWSGFIQLEAVSRLDDPLPVKAGGTLKMSVMMHVAPDGKVKLLQRVAAGVDTNGTPRDEHRQPDSRCKRRRRVRRHSRLRLDGRGEGVGQSVPPRLASGPRRQEGGLLGADAERRRSRELCRYCQAGALEHHQPDGVLVAREQRSARDDKLRADADRQGADPVGRRVRLAASHQGGGGGVMIVLATKNTKNTKSLGLAPDPQKNTL